MVIAVIALIAGLSGSAIAKPVAHLIGGKQIKKNAITSRHVKNGSLRMSDLNTSVRNAFRSKSSDGQRGPQGPQGPKGDRGPRGLQGPAGPAGRDGSNGGGGTTPSTDLLFAKVNQNGSLASKRGAIAATVTANGTTKTVTFDRDISKCVPAVTADNLTQVTVSVNLVTVKTATPGDVYLLVAC